MDVNPTLKSPLLQGSPSLNSPKSGPTNPIVYVSLLEPCLSPDVVFTESVRFQEASQSRSRLWGHELSVLLQIAFPILGTLLLEWTLGLITLKFVGSYNKVEVAGAALGMMWHQVTMIFGFGMLFAMDTIVAQSYGSGNKKSIGYTAQRALPIIMVLAIPIGLTWIFSEFLLTLVRQDAEASHIAGEFVRLLLPGLLPFLIYVAMQKFLQGQEIVWPTVVTGLVVNGFHVGLSFVLVKGIGNWPGIGYDGAPLALSLSRCLLPLALLAYILLLGLHKEAWPGWSLKEMFNIPELKRFLFLGFGSGLMMFFEVLGFEVNTFLAGYINTDSLAAQTIVANIYLLAWMIPAGFSAAAAVRVGGHIGSGHADGARRATWIAVCCGLCIGVVNACLAYILRYRIAWTMVDDKNIQDIIIHTLPIAAGCHILDTVQNVFAGVLRGAGKPLPGTILNFVAYYVISIPLAGVFVWELKWGLIGIWGALCIGMVVVSVSLGVTVVMINWENEVLKVKEWNDRSDQRDALVSLVAGDKLA